MLYFQVYFLQLLEIINQVLSKIKLECNLEVILSILAVGYFILIAIHYFSYQNNIDKAILIEQELNSKLEELQERNNQDALNSSSNESNNAQDIISINNNFIELSERILDNFQNYNAYSYNRILKKNNVVFINLQYNKLLYINNANKILEDLSLIYKDFDYSIHKIRKVEDFLKIYLYIKLK